ncbi:BLUF domain-containing protein [Erythrobacteraceae bacterium CFH 75059]|uniref:BLUF domain-containing protein n=1 Tax=Qipengyuania thermophila TaxID=2509361 RepID=UPI0010220ECB|nr:BLUF domain-containing protein [Qipengyuania thermophila]TCD06497.1 BLUF domain-containing protein [Erythrobacteraceae bacterium CFH 75059]
MSDHPVRARLCRLLYTSRMAPPAAGAPPLDLHALARSSAAANSKVAITGSLLLVDGVFVQILEGPVAMVETTFERICADLRHRDLQLVDLVDTDARLFGEWGMACLDAGGDLPQSLRSDAQDVRCLVGVNAAAAVRQMKELFAAGLPALRQTGGCAPAPVAATASPA